MRLGRGSDETRAGATMRLARLGLCVGACAVALLVTSAPALAAPVTIGFEDLAAGTHVTNQYATSGGIPEGPTFETPGAAGFSEWTSAECGAGHVSSSYAHAGGQSLKADGCGGGEFWGTSTFFAMGYTTDSVSFYLDDNGVSSPSATAVTTAFDVNHHIVAQVTTTLSSIWNQVSVTSATDNIAYVAVELGAVDGNTGSPTGVSEGAGNSYLYLDDLTYDPPSSPPAASFSIGADPAGAATADGASVNVTIPVNWFNNPNPSAYPVTLAATTPTGVTASFSPNPTSSGSATLTLAVADSAPTGEWSVTVTGTQGALSSSVTIPFGISSPFTVVNPGQLTLAPCTPRALKLSVDTASSFTQPVTISVATGNQSQVRITGISGPDGPGTVTDASDASVTVTPSGGSATATVDLAVPSGAVPSAAASVDVTAQAAGFQSQSNDSGTLAIETGQIDHVYSAGTTYTPSSVHTSWLTQAGSSITLVGGGFCPGSTVYIGDANNPVAPTSLASDGTSLTFSTPLGATTGQIGVIPSEHALITGPSLTVRTFRNTWGFSIKNGNYHTLLSQDMEDQLFGIDQTNWNVFGWLVRKPEAYEFQTITNNHVPGGLCFGFGYASLEFFDKPADMSIFPTSGGNDPWHIDTSTPALKQSLINFIVERFSLQFTDQLIPIEVNAVAGIHGTNDDLNAIKAGLASGEPVLIGMIHWNGASIEGHTVLAYRTEQLPDGSTAVDVVNSNEPYLTSEESNAAAHDSREFTNSQIIIANGNWTFPEGAEFQGSNGQPWSGSEADLVIYPHSVLPIINGQTPALPNVLTGTLMVAFGSSSDGVTQLSGSGGGELFKRRKLAPRSSWPAGAAPLPSFTSARGPLQLVGLSSAARGTVTAAVSRGRGGGAMSMYLPGLEATLNAGVHAGQLDHVSVNPHADEIGYTAGAPTPLGGTLLSAPTGASTAAAAQHRPSDRVVRFQTTAARGGGDTVALPRSGQFTLTHLGAAASLSVTLGAFAADGQPIAVTVPTLRLAPGSSVQVAPSSWSALGSSPIRITVTVHGHRTTRTVRGTLQGRRFATVRKASLGSVAHGRYGARVALRVAHAPTGSWLSIAVTVLRGRRTVAVAKPVQLIGAGLRSATARLALPRRLARGRYSLRVRLLEATVHGAIQGSVVVSRTLAVRT